MRENLECSHYMVNRDATASISSLRNSKAKSLLHFILKTYVGNRPFNYVGGGGQQPAAHASMGWGVCTKAQLGCSLQPCYVWMCPV